MGRKVEEAKEGTGFSVSQSLWVVFSKSGWNYWTQELRSFIPQSQCLWSFFHLHARRCFAGRCSLATLVVDVSLITLLYYCIWPCSGNLRQVSPSAMWTSPTIFGLGKLSSASK